MFAASLLDLGWTLRERPKTIPSNGGKGGHGGVCVGENLEILTTHCQSGEWEYIYEMYARAHTYA